jgi:phospholipase C
MKHSTLAIFLYLLPAAFAGSLTDIKNVVFMLQSGRSFDHVSTHSSLRDST